MQSGRRLMSSELLEEAIEDQHAGRLTDAAAKLRKLVAERPDDVAAQERLGLVHHALGDLPSAASTFEALCRLQPASASAHNNLASVLGQMGRFDDAMRRYEQALAIDADFGEARFNLAQILEMRGQSTKAIEGYREVVARLPAHRMAWYRLGYLLFASGFRDDAQDAYRHAIALDAEFVEPRWALAMSTLPLAYDLGETPQAFYDAFSTRLAELDRWFAEGRDGSGHRAVGNQQPYYIVYHDHNNRDVLARYGDLCARLMSAWYGDLPVARATGRAAPAHIVVVSGNVHDHAVWTAIVRGWCRHIDRSRYRISILYTDTVVDRETDLARSSVDQFIFGKKELGEWVDTIRQLQPDVLIYPEVGMDRMCIKLAALRLAPVQVASWGHPETTGMPTIDYFLSAEAFEPADAQQNYRERLVPLAGIGANYAALAPPRVDLDLRSLGIDPDVPIALCPATPYKFLPEHDWTFAAIAKGAPRCQFVFVTDNLAPHLSTQLARRLRDAFERAGLDYSRYVHFINHQARPQYFSLMRQSALYLDTIVFSGFNTAMQAFECGLPVVTVEGRFLRSRFASGLLRQMGTDTLVASNPREYVDRAVALLTGPALLQTTRQAIAARFPSLLDQQESIRSLERFLESALSRAPAPTETSTSWLAKIRDRLK
jgi:protein O-GlcNAc transferase